MGGGMEEKRIREWVRQSEIGKNRGVRGVVRL